MTPANDLVWLRDEWRVLSDKVDSVLQDAAEQRGICKGCRNDITCLKTTVYGNGKAGLEKDVDRLKQRRAFVAWIAGAAIALVSALLGGWAQGWAERTKKAS